MPSEDLKKPLFPKQQSHVHRTTVRLPTIANAKSIRAVNNFLKLKELGTKFSQAPFDENLPESADLVLNLLTGTYVFLSKDEVSGLSGYVCNECLGFEFLYVKDVGHDLSAEEKHQCIPSMIREAKILPDKNTILNDLRMRAMPSLYELAYSTFPRVKEWSLSQQVTDRGFVMLITKAS